MKKKELVTIIVMIVLVVVLVVGYILAKNMNESKKKAKEEEEATQTELIDLYDLNADDIDVIKITNDMSSFEMVKEGEVFYQKDTQIPLKSEDTDYMVNNIINIDAIRTIEENAEKLSVYGLDEPSLQYTISMKDGTTYDLKFGSKLQTSVEAYYAIVDETNTVYSVAANYYEPFYVSFEEITAIDDEVYINIENITKFSVSKSDGTEFSVAYVDDDFEGSDYYKWEIQEPYKNVLVDTDSLNEIINSLSNMAYNSCVSYDCNDMAEYGLDNPAARIDVEFYDVKSEATDNENAGENAGESAEEAEATPVPEDMRSYSTFILNIGSRYTEGENSGYYVNPEGSSSVYRVDATVIETITGFTPYSIADHCIYTILADQLTGYDIEYEGEKISVERKTEDDADVYYVNGKKVETENLLRLFSAAYLLTYSGEADKEKATPDEDAVLTLTYYRNNGQTDVVKYIPYDGNDFYQVDNRGVNYFLTDKRGIDDLIRRYKEYMEENF